MASRYEQHPVYIQTPPYEERSGGVRALHHLCHHLNRTGFHAFVLSARYQAPRDLDAPPLTEETRRKHLCRRCEPIAVYGECEIGNPLGAPIVVRYLL